MQENLETKTENPIKSAKIEKEERVPKMHLDLICFDDTIIAKFSNKGLSTLRHNKAFEQTLLLNNNRTIITVVNREDYLSKLESKIPEKLGSNAIEMIVYQNRVIAVISNKGLSALRKGSIVQREFELELESKVNTSKMVFMNHNAYLKKFHPIVKNVLKEKIQEKYDDRDKRTGKKSGIVE